MIKQVSLGIAICAATLFSVGDATGMSKLVKISPISAPKKPTSAPGDLNSHLAAQNKVKETGGTNIGNLLTALMSLEPLPENACLLFVQVLGLSENPYAQMFDIPNLKMAIDYLQHPTLGTRLISTCNFLNTLGSGQIIYILNRHKPRFVSCMTLFSEISYQIDRNADNVFFQVLNKISHEPCKHTITVLEQWGFKK